MRYRLLFGTVPVVLACTLVFGADSRSGEPSRTPGAVEREVQDFVYLGEKRPLVIRFHVRIDGKPLLDVWEAYIGKVFAYLDVNGDGVLSKEEAERVPPAQLLFNNAPAVLRPQQLRMPAAPGGNRGGKMTRQDLANFYRRAGAAPFQFQMTSPQQNQVQFVFAGQPQAPTADALNEKLFTLLDANKDGKLSRQELAAAPALLQKLDADDDETINVQEMAGNPPVSTDGAVVFAIAQQMQQAPTVPFVMVKAGESSKDLARQLQQRYGPRGKQPGSRKLTRQHLGLDQATFERLDVDQDGVLDSEELARFARRAPDLEFRVRLGKKDAKQARMELIPPGGGPTPLSKQVRSLGDGTLALDLGSTQLDLRSGRTEGDVAYARVLRQQYEMQFKRADRDNNGYIDKSEADRSPFFRGTFKMMDRDGDGKLFEKEMFAYLDRMRDLQAGAMASCASLTVKDQGRGLFDLVDGDGDGRLSVREMRRMVKLIDQLDRDGDGRISRKEIPHKYQVEVRQGPASNNQFTSRAVLVRRMGMNQQPLPPRTAGPLWFRKMDRNQDGDVSRREFLGTDEEFRTIDRDGDGLISAAEADQADKLFRKDKP